MKRTISETEFYQVKVDVSKNRMYVTLKGAWRSPEDTPHYVKDLTNSARMLKGRFTMLVNFSMLLPFTKEVWEKVHSPALKALMHYGLGRSSQILPRNEEATAQLEDHAQRLELNLMAFGDEEIAERFLER